MPESALDAGRQAGGASGVTQKGVFIDKTELPHNWDISPIDNISTVIMGQSPPSSTYNTDGKGLPFFQGKGEFGSLYPNVCKWCSKPSKIAQKNAVLISVRAPVGPTNLAPSNCCIGRGLAAIHPAKGIPSKYVLYYLRSIESDIESLGTGTTFKAISGPTLRKLPIPVAPPNEQKRIVAEIEKQFSHLDEAVNALKRIKANFKRYKASILKAAVEGKLTEGWREQHPDVEPASKLLKRILTERRSKWEGAELEKMRAKGKEPKDNKWKKKYKEPEKTDTSSLLKLPKEWEWVSWESILSFDKSAFKRGPFGSSLKKSIFVETGYKVYEQYCPINDDCSFARYFITEDKYKELESFAVQARDFLISCSGTLGRITQVPDEYEEGIINQALLRVRINNNIIDDAYFLMLFRSPYFQKQIFDSATGSAIPNVKGVNDLKAIPLPLPPIEEQMVIVRELDESMSLIAKIEKQVEANLKRAERLRQSIFKKAFSGKLVPQGGGG